MVQKMQHWYKTELERSLPIDDVQVRLRVGSISASHLSSVDVNADSFIRTTADNQA